MIAMMKEVRIFCQINPLMMAQLSAIVAPLVGRKALIKIINKGIITKSKETKAKGIKSIQFLLLLLRPNTFCFKILESKLIRCPFHLVNHRMYTTGFSFQTH
jgi:hypothetical protein